MSIFLDSLRFYIEQIISSFGYVGIFIVTFIEGVFPPIPSEIIIPFSGFLIQKGELQFLAVLAATTAGSMLAALLFYHLGKAFGEERVRVLFRKYGKYLLMSEDDFNTSLKFFLKHSSSVILWSRFVPGIRSLISIPAGVAKMRYTPFVFFTILGTASWNALLLFAGLYLGEQWELILTYVDQYDMFIYLLVSIIVALWIISRALSLYKQRKQD